MPIPDLGDADVPPVPGATKMVIVPEYVTYWSDVEQCSGVTGDMHTVTIYQVLNTDVVTVPVDGTTITAQGVWLRHGNRIVMAGLFAGDPKLMKHEMLHALLQRGDHPTAYFVDRCDLAYPQSGN